MVSAIFILLAAKHAQLPSDKKRSAMNRAVNRRRANQVSLGKEAASAIPFDLIEDQTDAV
jgi:hypothetical protein